MNFNIKTSFLIVFAVLSLPEIIVREIQESKQEVAISVDRINQTESHYISNYQFEKGYEEAIGFIKKHEGYANGLPYYDASGNKTIGFGHKIKVGELFPERISLLDAENLLKKDFDIAIASTEKLTNLKGYKKIAIAHFIYARGIGNFMKSNLRKKIILNQPIDDELMRWVFYKSVKGDLVESDYIKKIRRWEVNMYNRES
jgi:GH24 family phage-related lysozyme (muramidase)